MNPRRVALASTTDRDRAVVLLCHAADDPISGARDAWAQLSAAGHLVPVICVGYEPSRADAEVSLDLGRATRLLDDGAWSDESLMHTLHGAGELGRVDVISMATAALSSEEQAQLSQGDVMLRRDLRRIASSDTRVLLHRVWLPEYGDGQIAPSPAFVDAAADVAYVVLPTDRQFDRAMAMPLSVAADSEAFRWHVAVEIASLAGLWATMRGAPLELVDPAQSGVGTPLVRLVRTIGRGARINAPSPDRMLEKRALPLVPGCLPAPDPAHAVRIAANEVFPDEFRLPHEEADGDGSASTGLTLVPSGDLVQARREAIGLVGSALVLHDETVEAMQHLDDYAADTAAIAPWCEPLVTEAVGSWDLAEWTELRTSEDQDESAENADSGDLDDDDGDELSPSATRLTSSVWNDPDDAVAEARSRLDADRPLVSLEDIPVSSWDRLLIGTLGVADASTRADARATSSADSRYVVLEPASLAPVGNDVSEVLTGLDQHADGRRGDGANASAPVEASSATAPSADSEAGVTLLSAITGQFDDEISRASNRIDSLLEALRAHLHPANRPEPGVTTFVAYALLASLLTVAGALLTLTPLREVLTPDHFSDTVRVGVFALVSLVTTLPPVLRLTPSRSMPAQVRLMWLTAVYAASATTLVVMANLLAASFLDVPGRWLPAVVVVVAVLMLATVARLRDFDGDRSLLGPLAPLVADTVASVVPLTYIFVMAVAALNYDATAPSLFENRNWRLLTIVLVTAGTVAVVAAGLVQLVRRRDRRQSHEWKLGIDDLVERVELAAHQHEALRMLKGHWLGTAVVLARLVNRPFGSEMTQAPQDDLEMPVRKLLFFDLDMAPGTREDYLAELLPLIAPRGWLHQQYRRMADRFVDQERARHGIRAEEDLPPPEHNSYPTSLGAARRNDGSDARWRFAREVHQGAYDTVLRETASEAVEHALQATFMSERVAVRLDPDSGTEQTLPSLLAELLPVGEARLPAAALPPSTEVSPKYTPYVWWPDRLPMPQDRPAAQFASGCQRVPGSLLFHAIRVDVSEPLEVERLQSATAREAGREDRAAVEPEEERRRPDPLM